MAGVLLSLVGPVQPAGGIEPGTPEVVLQSGTEGCNGVRTTPGSENTTKQLDPGFASDFNPGGVVGYVIDYPVDADDVSGRETFVITDCVFVGATAVAKYTVSFVPNTVSFELRFAVPIPADTPLGAQFCNYAKTTAAPSASQASNRKAGPACFTVGGGLRVEKRSGTTTGPLLPGATFSVACTPTVALPPTIVTGLSSPSQVNASGTVTASGTSASGTIAIVGPSGTPCTVTETAAPAGYQFDATPRNLVIPVGTSQTVDVFVNRQLGDLVVSKTTTGGTGTFTFDVDCDDDGDGFDQQVSVTNSGSRTISGIPVGTTCTVTERANGLFTSVSVPANGQVVMASGTNTVAFTNTRNTGDLVVTKTTSGGTGTFGFTVDCDGTAFDRQFTIATSGVVTIPGIPTGTTCTVTETADPLFTSASTPADGSVTIDVGTNTVAFANRRNVGDLVVAKTTNGGSGTFTFDVDCEGTDFDRQLTITDSGQQRVAGIPTGTSCTVTEQAHDLFSSLVVPAGGAVTIAAGDNLVSFTNTRNVGDLVVAKTTTGGTGTFSFTVDCDGTAFDQTVVIEGSGSKTIAGIPTTTSCTVTEAADALFTSAPQPADGEVTIGASPVTAAFTNTARPTGIALDKKVNGGDHATAGDALVVHAGDPLTYAVTVTNTGQVPLTMAALTDTLRPTLLDSCPQGIGSTLAPGDWFTCTYTTRAVADADNVAAVTGADGLGRRPTASDGTFVDVVNPAVTITKTATPASVTEGGVVTFTYTVTNTGDTPLRNVTVTDDVLGGIGVVESLAPGASATLTRSQTIAGNSPTRNTGTVTGVDVLGREVRASAFADITIVLGAVIELPRTGASLGTTALAGVALFLLGSVLLLARRRQGG